MAYIGVAVLEGTKMWEERRRTEEADRRLQAEKELWNQTTEAATALATARNAEVQKAASMQKVLAENSGKIVAGGEAGAKGIAAFYNAQLGNTNDYEYKGTADGKIQLVDKKTNKVVQETAAPSGQDAVIALRGLAQDLTAQYNTAASIAAESRKHAREMDKMAQEYGFKFNQSKMEKTLDLQGTLGAAGIKAAADRDVANIDARADITKTYIQNAENLTRANSATAVEIGTGRPTHVHNGILIDSFTGMPVNITNPTVQKNISDASAALTTSMGNNPFATLSYNKLDAGTAQQHALDINSLLANTNMNLPTLSLTPATGLSPTSTFLNTGLLGMPPVAWYINAENNAKKNSQAPASNTTRSSGLSDLITAYGTGY